MTTPRPAAPPEVRTGMADTGRLGVVADTGGGEVRVLVDRDLVTYPAIGAEVFIAPATEPLDVERLATAMDNVAMGPTHEFNLVMARVIAPEYSRLTEKAAEGYEWRAIR